MTLFEARLRRAAADLPPERALQVVGELVDTIVELLDDLPPHYSKITVERLVAQTFRGDMPVDRPRLERLRLVVANDEAQL